MNDIHSSLNDGHKQILITVHTLKSGSNNVGARRLAAVVQKPEMLIKAKNYEVTALMLGELQDTFAEAHGVLNNIVKKAIRLVRHYDSRILMMPIHACLD